VAKNYVHRSVGHELSPDLGHFPKKKKEDVPERLRSPLERRHIHEMESRNVAEIEISRIRLSRKEDASRAIKLDTIKQYTRHMQLRSLIEFYRYVEHIRLK